MSRTQPQSSRVIVRQLRQTSSDIKQEALDQQANQLLDSRLDAEERRFLTTCLLLRREYRDCLTTPSEELVMRLIQDYPYHALTPERLKIAFDEFKENYNDAITIARKAVIDHAERFQDLIH